MAGIEPQMKTAPCCLCLSEDESTFHSSSIMKSLPLHEMVEFCIGIQINVVDYCGRPTAFSTSICNECVLNINNFYTFKKKVLEAQELINSSYPKNDSQNVNPVEYVEDEIAPLVASNQEIQTVRIVKVTGGKKRTTHAVRQNKQTDDQTERVTIQMNECLICPAILGDVFQLQEHIESHKDIRRKACNRQFARYSNLKRHFNSVHSKPKPFQCDVCGLGFNFSVNLQTHAALHYSGKIKRKNDNASIDSQHISLI